MVHLCALESTVRRARYEDTAIFHNKVGKSASAHGQTFYLLYRIMSTKNTDILVVLGYFGRPLTDCVNVDIRRT